MCAAAENTRILPSTRLMIDRPGDFRRATTNGDGGMFADQPGRPSTRGCVSTGQ